MIFFIHEFKIFIISLLCVGICFFLGFVYAKSETPTSCGQRDWLLGGSACGIVYGLILFLILKGICSHLGWLDIKIQTQEQLNYLISHKHGVMGMLLPMIANTVIGLNAGVKDFMTDMQRQAEQEEDPTEETPEKWTWPKMKKILLLIELTAAVFELFMIIKQIVR